MVGPVRSEYGLTVHTLAREDRCGEIDLYVGVLYLLPSLDEISLETFSLYSVVVCLFEGVRRCQSILICCPSLIIVNLLSFKTSNIL